MMTEMWTVGPWRRATALTVGVLLAMTACGSGSDKTAKLEPRLQKMVPTGTPAVTVMPLDGQPEETRPATGKYHSMYVPANFQEKSVLMANGEQMVAYDAPSSSPATPVRVVVAPDSAPKQTAVEQSYGMELTKTAKGMKDLTRTMVKWPGAQTAVLLQWTETPAGALATDEPQRNWQIMAQVNDHLIVNVLAFAPAGEFDTAGLAKIVQTFRPHA
jgi:hypothetical protein